MAEMHTLLIGRNDAATGKGVGLRAVVDRPIRVLIPAEAAAALCETRVDAAKRPMVYIGWHCAWGGVAHASVEQPSPAQRLQQLHIWLQAASSAIHGKPVSVQGVDGCACGRGAGWHDATTDVTRLQESLYSTRAPGLRPRVALLATATQ
jgi:hypothetical protein